VQERLAAAVQRLTRAQLLSFSAEVLGDAGAARKAVIAVHTSSGPAAAAAAAACARKPCSDAFQPQPMTIGLVGEGEGTDAPHVLRVPPEITDFKRGMEAWPSAAGLYGQWRRRRLQGLPGRSSHTAQGPPAHAVPAPAVLEEAASAAGAAASAKL
jgi:hypothetical protein